MLWKSRRGCSEAHLAITSGVNWHRTYAFFIANEATANGELLWVAVQEEVVKHLR